ncbi:MAG: hypothetical protein ABIO40_11405 [Devosia sp.]
MPDSVEPPFRLAGLSLWVRGYQFPDAKDDNWLRIRAVLATSSSHAAAEGNFLQTLDLQLFAAELENLYRDLNGTATLMSTEPNLHAELTGDGLGHIRMRVSLTPDHMTETHSVTFNLDQTMLNDAIRQLRGIDANFPVRRPRAD